MGKPWTGGRGSVRGLENGNVVAINVSVRHFVGGHVAVMCQLAIEHW